MRRQLFCAVSIFARVLAALLARPAWAQDAVAQASCPPGEVCGEAAIWGAWGLIALGVLFFLVALVPSGPKGEGEAGKGLPLLGMLQVRIEKETTGWRRLQWPLLGLLFIGLGVATLAGWR